MSFSNLFSPEMELVLDPDCFLIGPAYHVCMIWLDRVVISPLLYRTRLHTRQAQPISNRLKNNNTKRHSLMARLVPFCSNRAALFRISKKNPRDDGEEDRDENGGTAATTAETSKGENNSPSRQHRRRHDGRRRLKGRYRQDRRSGIINHFP